MNINSFSTFICLHKSVIFELMQIIYDCFQNRHTHRFNQIEFLTTTEFSHPSLGKGRLRPVCRSRL
jgi:hypothetical protein